MRLPKQLSSRKLKNWSRVKALHVDWPDSLRDELVSKDEQKDNRRTAGREQKVLSGVEAQIAVVNAGASFWSEAKSWAVENRMLSAMEIGIFETAASIPDKIPSHRQSAIALEALVKLQEEGCQLNVSAVAD